MKNLFTLLSLATSFLFAAGCKKTDNSIPTPQTATIAPIIGEYSLSGTQTFTTNGKSASNSLQANAALFVMGTDKTNTFYFLEKYGTVEAGYFVTMNGPEFICEKIVDEAYPEDKNRWIGYRSGSGKVSGNTIIYQAETPGFSIQNVYTNYPTSITSMSRKTSFTATKK